MSCCGDQKRRKWRGQVKGMGARWQTLRRWSWRWNWKQTARGRDVGKRDRPRSDRVWQDVHQVQIQEGGGGWRYQGQEGPIRERREVGEGTVRDTKLRARLEGVLGVQVPAMEYVEIPEGTGKAEGNRKQEGGVDVWVTGGREAVLQLQHRDELGAGWGAERAVQIQTDRAEWLEPGWRGRCMVAARGQRWWGWHMTWRADHGEEVPVRKEWGGELPAVGEDASGVRAHFTRAVLAPSPTTQGHRGQEVVYAVRDEMALKATEAIKMALDHGAARMEPHIPCAAAYRGHVASRNSVGGRHGEYGATAGV